MRFSFIFILYFYGALWAADAQQIKISLDAALIAKAQAFKFDAMPRCGFQSLAHFLILNGSLPQDVKHGLIRSANLMEKTYVEKGAEWIFELFDFVHHSSQLDQNATNGWISGFFSLGQVAGEYMLPDLFNYADARPDNLLFHANKAFKDEEDRSVHLQGFDDETV